MKIKYLFLFAALASLSFTSCSESFLDHAPDERTEIDTEDKVIKLLNSAYPGANYSWIAELSSDNLIDNQAPHMPTKPWEKQVETHYNWSSYDRWDDQLFKFEPATLATYSDYDSPGMLWSDYYSSIAICNSALDAIEKITADKHGEMSDKLKAARAEAYLVRAYSHFGLVNMFCQAYKDEEASKKDIGVPYVTELEDVVQKEYNRGNVAEVYNLIQQDLEKGLADISEINYTVPKWHFNVNAAHAFAARFYLYKRDWSKVIEHANAVLGTDNNTLMNMMMDYSIFTECSTGDDFSNAWQNPQLNNNLMLLVTNSLLQRRCFGYRYSCAGLSARDIFMISSNHDFWKSYYVCPIALVSGMCFGSSTHDYGYINSKIFEQFEYSDKIARIGYPHIILRAFTANELLLERAEAYIMQGKYDTACEDLCAYWNNSIDKFSEEDYKQYYEGGYILKITKAMIEKYYGGDTGHGNCFKNWDFTQQNVSSSYVIPHEATAYMNCLNAFRRFETMFEGLRFFDMKRWGMDITHEYNVTKESVTLSGHDPRFAIEVPWETISAGLASSRGPVEAASSNRLVFDAEDFRIK